MNTVWKFQDICVTQILSEINFGDSRSAKSAIVTDLEPFNSDLYDFLQFLNAELPT